MTRILLHATTVIVCAKLSLGCDPSSFPPGSVCNDQLPRRRCYVVYIVGTSLIDIDSKGMRLRLVRRCANATEWYGRTALKPTGKNAIFGDGDGPAMKTHHTCRTTRLVPCVEGEFRTTCQRTNRPEYAAVHMHAFRGESFCPDAQAGERTLYERGRR